MEASFGPLCSAPRAPEGPYWLAERDGPGLVRIAAGGGAGRGYELCAVIDVDQQWHGDLGAAGRQALVRRWPLYLDRPVHGQWRADRPHERVAGRAVSQGRRSRL